MEQGVYSIEEALRIADELDADLIEISPNAVPPVCRVADYQKFLYQQKKSILLNKTLIHLIIKKKCLDQFV